MTDLTITEIFFIITGVAVVIITALLAVGIIYLILFLRTIKRVAKAAQRASEIVSEDLSTLRDNIKHKGFSLGALANFAKDLGKKKIYRRKK